MHSYYTFRKSVWKEASANLRLKTRNKWDVLLVNTRGRRDRLKGRIIQSLTSTSQNTQSQYSDSDSDSDSYTRHAITMQEPFRKEWFTPNGGYPLTSKDPTTGRFVNPWNSQSTNGFKRWEEVWRWRKTRNFKALENSPKSFAINANSDEGCSSVFVGSKTRKQLKNQALKRVANEIKLTWIGHATNLIHVSDAFTVLTDPIFSRKASPFQFFQESEFLGVPRWFPPSLLVDDLMELKGVNGVNGRGSGSGSGNGGIDVCVISHDHYDHLDMGSVQELHERDLVKYWAVPLGMKDWLMDNVGIAEDRIVELEWWESVTFVKGKDGHGLRIEGEIRNIVSASASASASASGNVRGGKEGQRSSASSTVKRNDNTNVNANANDNEMVLTCAPAQHWCSRSPFDRNTRLWCSWAIHSKLAPPPQIHDSVNVNVDDAVVATNEPAPAPTQLSFYFAGDTGYPDSFPLHRQIGDRLGPFDLAAIPIGAYKPRFFMRDSHCDPREAVKIHQDIRSKRSVAIHWGTFPLANEPFEEPPTLLQKSVQAENSANVGGENSDREDGYSRIDFIAIPHGESIQSNRSSSTNRRSTSTSSSSASMEPGQDEEKDRFKMER